MGFTFSHPALILPVRYLPRTMYSMNGLIIGSMVPDFEYFIRLDNGSSSSHTFIGLLLFDLPAALIILTLYHLFIRVNLTKHLPEFLRLRFQIYTHFEWLNYLKKNWGVVCCSILIGALTHLFWDSFTSGNGYFVVKSSLLKTQLPFMGMQFYVYKIFKHVSSLIGFIVLVILLIRLPKQQPHLEKPNMNYWFFHALLALSIFLFQLALYSHSDTLNELIKKIVSSGLFSILLISIGYRMYAKVVSK